jgi:hypothetical protein
MLAKPHGCVFLPAKLSGALVLALAILATGISGPALANDCLMPEKAQAWLVLPYMGWSFLPAVRKDPRNRGNCYLWKNCQGDTVGNMWFYDAIRECRPMGGKSWRNEKGFCFNIPDALNDDKLIFHREP